MVEAAMLLKAPTRPVNRSGNRIASCATRSTTPTLRSATRKADSKSVMLLAPVVAPATVAFSITSATRDQPFSRAREAAPPGPSEVMTQAAKRMASVYRSISTVCSLDRFTASRIGPIRQTSSVGVICNSAASDRNTFPSFMPWGPRSYRALSAPRQDRGATRRRNSPRGIRSPPRFDGPPPPSMCR